MPPTQQPSEQPTGDLRQEIVSRTSTLIDALSAKIDAGQRKLFMEAIKKEDLPEAALSIIDSQLDNIQRLSRTDPAKALQILNKMIDVGGDGTLSPEDIQSFVTGAAPEMPESMSKISGMIEKMSTMTKQLGDQLSTLGSETIKMLAGFFGPDSLFGKVCELLKNQPKAQIAYLEKKLLQQNKTLSPDTTHEQIINLLKGQIVQGQNIERRGKQPPTYDIVQHVEQLMAAINPSKDKLALDDFKTAGEQVLTNYTSEIAGLAPAPAIAATATERVKKEVSTKLEAKIANDDTSLMIVEKISGGVKIEIKGKTAELKNINNVAITSAAILEANANDPAAIILTLADKTIQINATELKEASAANAKKTVKAKNLTTDIDMTFDVLFAA